MCRCYYTGQRRTEQGIETKSFENCSNKGMLPAGMVVGGSRQVEKLFIKIWCIFQGCISWYVCYCYCYCYCKTHFSHNFSFWILWVYVSLYDTNRPREAKFQEFSHPQTCCVPHYSIFWRCNKYADLWLTKDWSYNRMSMRHWIYSKFKFIQF